MQPKIPGGTPQIKKTPQEFWEDNRPIQALKTSKTFYADILKRFESGGELQNEREHLKWTLEQVEDFQIKRIEELVTIAWNTIPVYRDKYARAGITQQDIDNFDWEVYRRLPVITKDELISAFPDKCLNPKFNEDDLFPTRSSGSSGKTLLIRVDPEAIIRDSWQGIRQMELQSSGRYTKDDQITHIYTVPWWVDQFDGDYIANFISSLIEPKKQAELLEQNPPKILSLYPSNLAAILPYISDKAKSNLELVVVHSEQSSQDERDYASKVLGVPVLDEYSSEELTRIAIQLPDRKYYLCEDTVRVDIVDANDLTKITETGIGLVVGTNLLNTAMPFIKYLQGDVVEVEPVEVQTSGVYLNWRQVKKIEARKNDSFLRPDGQEIPAGTLLDTTYRWMFDLGLNVEQFEILQKAVDEVEVNLVEPKFVANPDEFTKSQEHFIHLFKHLLGDAVKVSFNLKDNIDKTGRKRRPIRKEF